MGWFNTLVNVADFAVGVNNQMKIAGLGQMQQESAEAEAIRNVMRDFIFRSSQAKEDLLLHRSRAPVAVAAGLVYLEQEIEESGITPNMFSDLGDKDYVASTVRSISNERSVIMEQLAPEQRELAMSAGQALCKYEEIAYIVNQYDATERKAELNTQRAQLERNKPKGMFSGAAKREWQSEVLQIEQQMAALGNVPGAEDWAERLAKHGHKSKAEFERMLASMEVLIEGVFQDRSMVPRISVAEIVVERIAAVSVQQAEDAKTITSSDGRIACPQCGYRNSKHRKTCKNCRKDM